MSDLGTMTEREVKQAINAFFAANPIFSARYRTPEKQAEIRQLHVRLDDIRQGARRCGREGEISEIGEIQEGGGGGVSCGRTGGIGAGGL